MSKQYETGSESQSLIVREPSSKWGGSWTEEKLDAFEKYVNAYLTIMNAYRTKWGWKLVYFDGFAGSGSRHEIIESPVKESTLDLSKELNITTEDLATYKGAAERVLNIKQQGFDYYYFIDKDSSSSEKLKERLTPIQNGRNFVFRSSDANEQVRLLAKAMHEKNKLKALVLLDPFGMQVEWDAIRQLEGTGTDLWILIPTGVIVNRLLDRKGELKFINKLTSFFGIDEQYLRTYFYHTKQETTLFGEVEKIEKIKEPIKKIAELYIKQMNTIFKHVTPQPLVLYNSRNTPIFHFACASNNKNAIKIASQIISNN